MKKIKKICVVTGTRAEYGLLYWFMKAIKNDKSLHLQIIVTGSHLMAEHGNTYKVIIKDGFKIDRKISILSSSDKPENISESTGVALKGFGNAYKRLRPDLVVLLGDRFELLSAAFAANISNIPIAHMHGGEITRGAFDDAIRHSITKMSHIHFTATNEYKKRVIQLGENPSNVHLVGGMGIENIKKLKLYKKEELEKILKINFSKKNLLITYHPVTLENSETESQIVSLLKALDNFKDINFIFTQTNADTNGRIIRKKINEFIKKNNKRSIMIKSMGQKFFLSTLKYVDGIIGNSSSGLLEAPSFKIGTINIGDRQTGRVKSKSIIDCDNSKKSIISSINKLYSSEFKKVLYRVKNPYDRGSASKKCVMIIKKTRLKNILKKNFYDI